MSIPSLFIESECQETKTVEAVSGVHPRLVIVYHPALAKERNVFKHKAATSDPAVIDAAESEVISKYIVSINGQAIAIAGGEVMVG